MTDLVLWAYERLRAANPRPGWWPADTPFEVMVGAILTQNTAWTNVEKAVAQLKVAGLLSPRAIVDTPVETLAPLIRSSGYFNVKAVRLKALAQWVCDRGGLSALALVPTAVLRADLLSVKGVGPETADDMLLYAFGRPVFVVDAYTRRLFKRLGVVAGTEDYEVLRRGFESMLPPDPGLFNEYHALIVGHGKEYCRPRPRCSGCPLLDLCPHGALQGA